MQAAGAPHLIQLPSDPRHPIADQPTVGLDLRFTRTAEEPETTALAFKVGPASDQSAGLIVEMGKFDLEPAFGGRGPLAENLEDQAGAIDHLGLGPLLQVTLLDRRDRRIDDHPQRPLGRGSGALAVSQARAYGFETTKLGRFGQTTRDILP